MPYHLSFPQAVDFMRDSQPLMLDNYASISTFIGRDHVQFNNGANSGKHAQLTFPLLTDNPPDQGMWTLFNKISASAGFNPRLFAKTASNDVWGFNERKLQFDQSVVNYAQLPSGIIFKWVQLPRLTDNTNPMTTVWASHLDTKPFTQQFWAAIWIASSAATDLDTIYYVTDVSNPLQVSYSMWTRNLFNARAIRDDVILFAIGI